jgi:hypothetical protein
MNTLWDYCLADYPVGSKWRHRASGVVYAIRELHDAELYVMVELAEVDGRNLLWEPHPSIHMRFERV